ncbi:MAG: hypothetical protein WBP92_00280 [Candidatus Acidiferrales bacterium]
MTHSTTKPGGFNWMPPSCAVLAVVTIYVSMAFWAEDTEFFASVLFIAPVLILVSIVLIIWAITRGGRQKRLTLLSTVAALWLTAMAMFLLVSKYGFAMRTTARWLIWSRDYKAEVLAQPRPIAGELRHIEWDGWGFAPVGDTTVYLVFDPSDSLSGAAKGGGSGRFYGIPCPVPEVSRLEKSWYVAKFYTDQDWNHCD